MSEKEFRVKHGVVVDTLANNNNEIVTLDNSGKLIASGVTVTDISGGLDTRITNLESINYTENEPTGFENRTDSTISYNPLTATFAISGNYNVWLDSVKYAKTGDSTVLTPAYGIQFIKYGAGGVFNVSNTPWSLTEDAPIAYVFFNSGATDSFVAEERHGITMDGVTHRYLHFTQGAKYRDGFAIGDYTLNSDTVNENKYSVATGRFFDEDIENTVPAQADNGPYTVFYRTGASGQWTWSKTESYPYLINANSIRYNQFTGGTWQLTDITTNNRWVNYYVFATNALTTGFGIVIIPGQTIYTSLANAQAESVGNLQLGDLPFQEVVAIAKVTHQFSTGFANANGRARIVAVSTLLGQSVTVQQASSNHNSLSGLQGGTTGEYYHLTLSEYSDLIGRTEVTSISGSLQSQLDSKVGFTGGLADRVAYWSSATSISASNLTVSEISPKTLTASSETEFLSAVSTLNSRGGGTIVLTGQIILTANRSITLDNIRIFGSAADANAIWLASDVGATQYVITVTGTNFYFDTVRFRGNNNGTTTTETGLKFISTGIANGVFENCVFRNCIGTNPTTNGFIILEASPTTGGWNVRFYNGDTTSDNNSNLGGLSINQNTASGFLNLFAYNNTRAAYAGTDNRSLIYIYGTNPTGNNYNIGSDGSYQITIGASLTGGTYKVGYTSDLITTQTEKTSFATNDYVLISDGANSNIIKKLNRSNMGFAESSSIPTSATFLTDYDNRYVNVAGDTMTGQLVLNAGVTSPRGAGTLSEGFGNGALASNTGIYNTAVGNGALTSNTTGVTNTAVGRNALLNNLTGTANVAIGAYALRYGTSPSVNVAIGNGALDNCNGSENIAIGYDAGKLGTSSNKNILIGRDAGYNVNGSGNVAVGFSALQTSTGSNNVAIGNYAGYNETGSNKLYIANSAGTSADALIYGEFDNDTVWINGTLNIATAIQTDDIVCNSLTANVGINALYSGQSINLDPVALSVTLSPSAPGVSCTIEETGMSVYEAPLTSTYGVNMDVAGLVSESSIESISFVNTGTTSASTRYLFNKNTSGIASYTINFPSVPSNGQKFTFATRGAITTLTWGGGTANTTPASAAANDRFTWVYNTDDSIWMRTA